MRYLHLPKSTLTATVLGLLATFSIKAQDSEPMYLGVVATPYGKSKAYVSGHREVPEDRSIFINIPEFISDSEGKQYTIDSIAPNALSNITNLKCVRIPGSVRSIGEHAFSYSPEMEMVFIGDGVERIESAAFYDCDKLRDISIPASVKYIDPEAFWSKNISSFNVAPHDKYYKSIDGALYSADGKTLVRIPHGVKGTFKVAPGTKVLGVYSCRSDELTEIILPEGLQVINYGAFLWDTKLEKVKLPESLKRLEGTVFGQCHSLKEITLPPAALYLGDNMFYECKSLESVTLPPGLKYIPSQFFYACRKLKSVNLPSSITSIGSEAFSFCGFEQFTLPATVTKLGNNPWHSCFDLKSISVAPGNQSFTSIDGVLFTKSMHTLLAFPPARSGRYIVPASVNTIGEDAFSSTMLNNIVLPDALTTIEKDAFMSSHLLREIVIPSNVRTIGDGAFAYSRIERIIIQNPDIMSIGSRIADKDVTIYVPDNCIPQIKSVIDQGTDLTKDKETGAFFSFAESLGVHNKSLYKIEPISKMPAKHVTDMKKLLTLPFGIVKTKDIWKTPGRDIISALETDNIEHSVQDGGIFVKRQIYTDIPDIGEIQILNHRLYFNENSLPAGYDFIFEIGSEENIAEYIGQIKKGAKKAGFKIDKSSATEKPNRLGGLWQLATKGNEVLATGYDKNFLTLVVLITYKDSPLVKILENIPDGKYINPDKVNK